jgi:predicted neuraminidase
VGASYQNPVLFEEPDGMLDLFHTTQPAGGGENNAQVLHLVSKDHGQNWSKPEVLFAKPGAYSRHPLVILDDGAWLLPMTYVTSAGIGKGAETNYSVAEISRDQGKSWRECPMADSQGKVQPTVVKLAGGGLRAFFRSRAADAIWTSTSADGCQWSPVEKTALPNNNASVQAFGLPDGHIAMVFDNSSRATGGLRKPLSVALSEDGGKSWPYVRDIEAGRPGFGMAEMRSSQPGREEYSYPSILETRQGEILVAFTYRRQTIKVVSFNEDWIRQRGSVGEYKGRQ